jgi:hypothetical protein
VANTAKLFTVIQNEAYQPLHVASYQIDSLLWRLDPVGCHLTNLLLFVLGCCLWLLFIRRLGVDRWTALSGVLLFALHPSHVESVVWISCRKDVLSLCFVCGMLLLHLRSKSLWDRDHILSVVLFVCAALTKTTTLFVPLVLPLVDLLALGRTGREAVLRALPGVLVSVVLGGLVAWIWQSSGLTRQIPPEGSGLALVFTTMAHYLTTILWPFSLSPLYPVDRAPALGGAALAGLVSTAVLVVAAWLARRKAPLATLGVALFLLALVPVSNVVPLYFTVNDRYLLLPLLALPLFAATAHGLFVRWANARAIAFAAALVLAGLWGGLSFSYSQAWRTDSALWSWASRTQPGSYYVWMKLGETLRDDGAYDDASAAYERAIALEPELVPARGALLLNCLLSSDVDGPPSMLDVEKQAPVVSGYMRSLGDHRSLLLVGLHLITSGKKRCGAMIAAEAIAMDPPFEDDVLMSFAEDMLGRGHVGLAGIALQRVTAPGRANDRYRTLEKRHREASPGEFPL